VGWEHHEEVLVCECSAVLSLPKESPHRLGVRASKLCWSRPSDPLDSRGGHSGYRSVLRRGAEPMNDMSDDSGSENSGNGFRADPAPSPVDLANGDLCPAAQNSRRGHHQQNMPSPETAREWTAKLT